jgi:polysaccharide pyruvyl transferase WcaK-like protein
MRFHSLLFAARAGTLIIPLPYAPKCEAWLEEHGLERVPIEGPALASAVRAAVGVGREMHVA